MSFPQYGEAGKLECGFRFCAGCCRQRSSLSNIRSRRPRLPDRADRYSTRDTTPPALQSFSFTPTAIDTDAGAQSVTVTAHITDDLSGFSSGQVCFTSPSGNQEQCTGWNLFSGSLTSGNADDGMYQVSVSFPQYGEAGNWNVAFVSVRDAVGNVQVYRTSDLAALGFPTALTVTSTQDTTPPALRVSFPPTAIDTDAGAQSVTVTAHITDDLSGFSSGQVCFTSPFSGIWQSSAPVGTCSLAL